MIRGLSRWFDARLHLAKSVRSALNHVFPDHWSFMLGEIALYSFVVLVITGTFLAMFFNASGAEVVYHGPYRPLDGMHMSVAYESLLHISFGVPAGLLIRQMHHWAALVFVAAITVHAARIFFTAAYRKPREINWIIGLTLLLLAMANGYFGYSLGDDLLSGAGLRIGYAILLSIPIIGPWMAYLVMGGTVPNPDTIGRMYGLHIFVVPAAIAILLALHLGIIWRQKHTNMPGPGRTNQTIVGARVWPTYTAKSLGLLFLVFGVITALGGLVQIDPVWLYGPYDPTAIVPGAQPDWYLGWIEGAMRLFPGVNVYLGPYLIPEVFFPAVVLPGLLFVVLYFYPFLEKLFSLDEKEHHVLALPRQHPFNTALGCAVFVGLIVLFFAGGDDVMAVASQSSVIMIRDILRVLVFVAPAVTFVIAYLLCLRARGRSPEELLTLPPEPTPESTAIESGMAGPRG